MKRIWARYALLPDGWHEGVVVSIDTGGRIGKVCRDVTAQGEHVGILLPSPVNVHSHAFQRAMAGLTERRGADPGDSFWTWRRLMYRFLDSLSPDHVEAIAAFAQMEMLQAGYATSAEFHYLHHRPDGRPYDNPAEMSERIAAAAKTSGIGLCLLPVHYRYGGCDGRPLGQGQVRFGNEPDGFHALQLAAGNAVRVLPPDSCLGAAAHSLRALDRTTLCSFGSRFSEGPLHLHLAEQQAEVAEVQAAWGARPVEWVLENMAIDDRWCMVHSTQMTADETRRLARTGAVAGLCPITECNLGDGIFDGARWLDSGGAIAIGSDSNVRIALAEEIRTLEYSQRLRDGTRAALATTERSSGRRLYEEVLTGGARAAGRQSGALVAGNWADMTALDDNAIHLAGMRGDDILDSWLFAGDDRLVTDVWSAGRHMIRDGQHIQRDQIEASYRLTMSELRGSI